MRDNIESTWKNQGRGIIARGDIMKWTGIDDQTGKEDTKGAVQRDPSQVEETEWENKCISMHQNKRSH